MPRSRIDGWTLSVKTHAFSRRAPTVGSHHGSFSNVNALDGGTFNKIKAILKCNSLSEWDVVYSFLRSSMLLLSMEIVSDGWCDTCVEANLAIATIYLIHARMWLVEHFVSFARVA